MLTSRLWFFGFPTLVACCAPASVGVRTAHQLVCWSVCTLRSVPLLPQGCLETLSTCPQDPSVSQRVPSAWSHVLWRVPHTELYRSLLCRANSRPPFGSEPVGYMLDDKDTEGPETYIFVRMTAACSDSVLYACGRPQVRLALVSDALWALSVPFGSQWSEGPLALNQSTVLVSVQHSACAIMGGHPSTAHRLLGDLPS